MIFFLANMGVHEELFSVPVSGAKPEQLTSGKHTLGDWTMSRSSSQQVYTSKEMTNPGDIWISNLNGGPKKSHGRFRRSYRSNTGCRARKKSSGRALTE
jgi:hypothetical protein